MGIPKGTKRKKWTFEEKLRIVNRYFNEHLGIKRLAKEENMDYSLLNRWIHKYMDNGESGLQPKKHPGNAYAAIYSSKSLSETERLKLIVAKQQIEIERLKKGYQVKGVGANKEFVSLKEMNS